MIFTSKPLDFNILKEKLQALPQSLTSFKQLISAVLLFGSLAQGKETLLSDIDIAILYSKRLSENEFIKVHSQVYEIMSDLLSTDEIDLVNLNMAPLSMQYGALKQAKVLVLNNKAEYIDFWERTVKYYLDFKPLLDECNQALLETLTRRAVHG